MSIKSHKLAVNRMTVSGPVVALKTSVSCDHFAMSSVNGDQPSHIFDATSFVFDCAGSQTVWNSLPEYLGYPAVGYDQL